VRWSYRILRFALKRDLNEIVFARTNGAKRGSENKETIKLAEAPVPLIPHMIGKQREQRAVCQVLAMLTKGNRNVQS